MLLRHLPVHGHIQVRVHVWHDNKAFFCKDFCSFDGFIIIRQQVFGVVNNFDLYKITTAEFPERRAIRTASSAFLAPEVFGSSVTLSGI